MHLAFYVDDVVVSFCDADTIEATAWKRQIQKRFLCTDKGPIQEFLGMTVTRNRDAGTLHISQRELISDLLARYELSDCNPVDTPLSPNIHMSNVDSPPTPDPHLGPIYREVVGTLQWLAVCTRADIAHAAQALARFNANPGEEHWKQAKRCLRYLKGTIDHGITYTRQSDPTLANRMYGFCDADWAADPDTRRSVGAYVLMLNGGAVAWRSKLQASVSMSTAEAEFIAASSTATEVVWLRRILHDLGASQHDATPLYEDNNACILLSENPSHKGRVKHIDLRIHSRANTSVMVT